MTEVIGIRFRSAGKIYYFAPGGYDVKRGKSVIVETSRGVEMGTVVMPSCLVEDETVVQPLKPILRPATDEDIEQAALNRAKEKSAFHVCKEKIRNHNLEMKLIDAEYTFDGSKLLFYFTADGRIDFRELVKDLAAVFKTRIELRQIGVRDETKILGGIGICGRVLCCHSYLPDFAPVSIKMAKEQNLSLNPTKISGTCGRLMCCLKNEEEVYEELNRKLPSLNEYVKTRDGLSGQVQAVDVLRQKVRVLIEKGDEKELTEFSVEDLIFKPKKGKKDYTDSETIIEDVEQKPQKEKKNNNHSEKQKNSEHKGENGVKPSNHQKKKNFKNKNKSKNHHKEENAGNANQG